MTVCPARLFVVGSFVMACCATVGRLPGAGETVAATGFSAEPGGKGFNVAVGARRLGAAVDGLLAVGDDMFGQLAESALKCADLPQGLLRRYPGATGAGIGFIQKGGENTIAVFSGANGYLSAADVRAVAARVESAAMVLAQFESPDAPIAEAFAIARGACRPTLLNPSPFRMIAPDILGHTNILVVNESEGEALAAGLGLDWGDDACGDSALAAELHARGLDLLVVTLGSRGAIAYPREGPPLQQPAYAVASMDTVGAGDAFIAAFAVTLCETGSLPQALSRGAANGAITASRAGTFDAFATRADLDRLIG